uniref:Uncharacterized protein n=1 Tax=Cyanoderma ruficeps TaxID=181631 RepID=A0A8C3NXX1_9PASS
PAAPLRLCLPARPLQPRSSRCDIKGTCLPTEVLRLLPSHQLVGGNTIGTRVPVHGQGDGEERPNVGVLGDGESEDGRGEVGGVVIDIEHLDLPLEQARAAVGVEVSDGHLELQEAGLSGQQVLALPQVLPVDGGLCGVDVPSLAIHTEVRGPHLQLVEVPHVR